MNWIDHDNSNKVFIMNDEFIEHRAANMKLLHSLSLLRKNNESRMILK